MPIKGFPLPLPQAYSCVINHCLLLKIQHVYSWGPSLWAQVLLAVAHAATGSLEGCEVRRWSLCLLRGLLERSQTLSLRFSLLLCLTTTTHSVSDMISLLCHPHMLQVLLFSCKLFLPLPSLAKLFSVVTSSCPSAPWSWGALNQSKVGLTLQWAGGVVSLGLNEACDCRLLTGSSHTALPSTQSGC